MAWHGMAIHDIGDRIAENEWMGGYLSWYTEELWVGYTYGVRIRSL